MSPKKALSLSGSLMLAAQFHALATENVIITDVPDYAWYAGCFGTASGNLMGYWDRNGFPNFYTGPTTGGVAPLNSNGTNQGIRSMWASMAGFDGRPADKPGHLDDYWENFDGDFLTGYESAATDPYVVADRPEHAPDCIGDFIGASQNKWADLDGECHGNINAFSFNFWDKQGGRRENFTPAEGYRDIQSGWRAWTKSRGYQANVFSQLADFNPNTPAGTGFTFENLKTEINAGYPVMLFLQNHDEFSRAGGINPEVHGMLAYGYIETDSGVRYVRYRTSWGSGDQSTASWGSGIWEANLQMRGVIGFHPMPQITSIAPATDGLHVKWDGPSSTLRNISTGATTQVHWYVIEKSDSLTSENFTTVSDPSPTRETILPTGPGFYRVRLVDPPADSVQ
jgi:hypothetical protein